MIRGFLQRRKYKVLKVSTEINSKYFKSDEAKETLSGKWNEKAPLVKRTHTYKTGAIYTGQWLGGMRQGQGTMVWPDNARYEGQWVFNQA